VSPENNVARKTFEWADANKGEAVMYKLPRNVMWNDNVVVKEDEYAVFFRDGKAMHVFDRPGRYALTTQNVPVLAKIAAAITGVKQLGEVYWLQRRELRGKFGTQEPLAFRDADFGIVRIRVFGRFAFKVTDPLLFISQFVGTEGYSHSDKVFDWLKNELVQTINATLGKLKSEKGMGVVDMPAYLNEIEQVVLATIEPEVTRYGLKITNIAGLNINLPEEVKEALDKRGAMGALGVNYMQYQTGKAIEGVGEGAAKGGGGGAGAFAGLGAGMGAGYGMASQISQGMQTQGGGPPAAKVACPNCNAPVDQGVKFCPECGNQMAQAGTVPCPKCGKDIPVDAKFCPECGGPTSAKCPKCGTESKGAKFCPECGEKM